MGLYGGHRFILVLFDYLSHTVGSSPVAYADFLEIEVLHDGYFVVGRKTMLDEEVTRLTDDFSEQCRGGFWRSSLGVDPECCQLPFDAEVCAGRIEGTDR